MEKSEFQIKEDNVAQGAISSFYVYTLFLFLEFKQDCQIGKYIDMNLNNSKL